MTPRPVLLRLARLARLRSAAGAVLLALATVLSALTLLAVVGAARDDAGIDARLARGTAEVLSVSSTRTLVRFATADGGVHTPDQGVAYPGGLAPGQLVRIEYDAADPQLVRVEGRRWTQGIGPALAVIGGVWLVAGPLAWWLRRGPGALSCRAPGRPVPPGSAAQPDPVST